MPGPYRPIVGTLGYILSPDRTRTLLVHRNARDDDEHLGKYNGLGGKMHPHEDIVTCMKREILEESGLEVLSLRLRGTINWTGFGSNGEDWLGFVFLIDSYRGEPYRQNPEGDLDWHPVNRLLELPMWEGDRHFLPLVFDDDPRVFHGYMPYHQGKPRDWRYVRV